jgi:hypothetical protein
MPLKLPAAEALPAKVKCPQCASRFVVNPDGQTALLASTALTAQPPAMPAMVYPQAAEAPVRVMPLRETSAPEGGSRTPLLLGVVAAVVLLLGGGVTLAVMFLSGGDEPKPAEKNADSDDGQGVFDPDKATKGDGDRPRKGNKQPVKRPDPVPPEQQKKINAAIDKGVQFLKDSLTGKPVHPGGIVNCGTSALAGLTLLNCGVKKDDPAVVKALTTVRAQVATLRQTYEMACCIWFLDKLGDPKDKEAIQALALALIASQKINGGWDYNSFRLTAAQQKDLQSLLGKVSLETKADLNPNGPKPPPGGFKGVGQLPADLAQLPVMQYQVGQKLTWQAGGWHEDNSLTQFVILALWAAQKHGVPTARSLAMAEARFRASQNIDGSWAYEWWANNLNNRTRTDSMTCAGLLGLAVGRGARADAKKGKLIGEQDKKKGLGALVKDPVVEKALAYLSKVVGKQGFPEARQGWMGRPVAANSLGDLYFLWSLERVGVVYNLQKIDGKDWYLWGSDLIVRCQQADGAWRDSWAGLPDTCFALLFLKRVNVVEDLTRKLQKLEASR